MTSKRMPPGSLMIGALAVCLFIGFPIGLNSVSGQEPPVVATGGPRGQEEPPSRVGFLSGRSVEAFDTPVFTRIPSATFIEPGGKHQAVRLRRLAQPFTAYASPSSRFPASAAIWKRLEPVLTASGLKKEQLDKARSAVERAIIVENAKIVAPLTERAASRNVLVAAGPIPPNIFVPSGRQNSAPQWVFDARRRQLSKPSRFMLGLDCVAANDALKTQMKLEKSGLLVRRVFDKGPAQKAGIRRHDVLVRADEQQLQTTFHLVEAVRKAGEGKRSMRLTLYRSGEKSQMNVTPTERKEVDYVINVLLVRDAAEASLLPRGRNRVRSSIYSAPQSGGNTSFIETAPRRTMDMSAVMRELAALRRQVRELQQEVKQLRQNVGKRPEKGQKKDPETKPENTPKKPENKRG